MAERCSSFVNKLAYEIKTFKAECDQVMQHKEEVIKALNNAKSCAEMVIKQRVKDSLNAVVSNYKTLPRRERSGLKDIRNLRIKLIRMFFILEDKVSNAQEKIKDLEQQLTSAS
uniref:Uncharacterized protein n=1 Tax=Cannabis sativa TaxID=3483 RepID=A0A803PSZ4_CANSA